jgi:hypothetical protein
MRGDNETVKKCEFFMKIHVLYNNNRKIHSLISYLFDLTEIIIPSAISSK